VKKIMAIIGSLSSRSSNRTIVEHVADISSERLSIEIYDGVRYLPQFNPDLDDDPPAEVVDLRRRIREADGVLISTPEYVFAVPGSLKNALDWTVSTADFREKPVMLIVASLSGEKAYESLLLTLKTIEARIDDGCSLLISHVKAKIKPDGTISDEQTLAKLNNLVNSFIRSIET
jgi:NAD(P)H-dependent FMN reductase